MSRSAITEFCPICGLGLHGVERVREERVPSTVPDWFSRDRQAIYRSTSSWEEAECANEHKFKRTMTGLYGMHTAVG